MSYCPNCGRQILDETMGCPVCNVRKVQETSWTSFENHTEEVKAETIDSFTVEDGQGNSHRFETNEETGNAEYQKKAKVSSEAKIHPALKVLVIALIVITSWFYGFGIIIGFIAGHVLSKKPSQDYRAFGSLLTKVSVVMLVLSFLCCLMGTSAGLLGIIINVIEGGSTPQISY